MQTHVDLKPAAPKEPPPRRILVIDDHPVVAEGWGRIIRGFMPCEILTAATALEGWRAWRNERPDMIVVDLTLGDNKVAGIKLTSRLRSMDSATPILVFTMHRSAVFAMRALQVGANGFIHKDSPADEICAAFQEVSRGGYYVDNRLAKQITLMSVHGAAGEAQHRLTSREEEILSMIAEGLTYQEIAERACISYKTVSNVTLTLKEKLGAKSLVELVVKAIRYFEGA